MPTCDPPSEGLWIPSHRWLLLAQSIWCRPWDSRLQCMPYPCGCSVCVECHQRAPCSYHDRWTQQSDFELEHCCEHVYAHQGAHASMHSVNIETDSHAKHACVARPTFVNAAQWRIIKSFVQAATLATLMYTWSIKAHVGTRSRSLAMHASGTLNMIMLHDPWMRHTGVTLKSLTQAATLATLMYIWSIKARAETRNRFLSTHACGTLHMHGLHGPRSRMRHNGVTLSHWRKRPHLRHWCTYGASRRVRKQETDSYQSRVWGAKHAWVALPTFVTATYWYNIKSLTQAATLATLMYIWIINARAETRKRYLSMHACGTHCPFGIDTCVGNVPIRTTRHTRAVCCT